MLAACGGARREEAKLAALEAGIARRGRALPPSPSGAPSAATAAVLVGPAAAAGGGSAAAVLASRQRRAAPLAASELIGAEAEALRRWFGDPDLRRPEGERGGAALSRAGLRAGSWCSTRASGGTRVAHAARAPTALRR